MTQRTAEEEDHKRFIYDKLSPRRKKFIDRIGYEKWDPFQEPKHPIEIRKDQTQRTMQQLIREFMQTKPERVDNSAYASGVMEVALGLINRQDRLIGTFEFSVWYHELMKKEGITYEYE